jgi:hypothetical protein
MVMTQVRFEGNEGIQNENKKCLHLSFVSSVSPGVGCTDVGAGGVGQRQGVQALRELPFAEFGNLKLAGFPLGLFQGSVASEPRATLCPCLSRQLLSMGVAPS